MRRSMIRRRISTRPNSSAARPWSRSPRFRTWSRSRSSPTRRDTSSASRRRATRAKCCSRARVDGGPRAPFRGLRRIVLNRVVGLTVINPATEEAVAELEEADVEEADAAVARAKEAFPAWRAVPPSARATMLRRLAGLVEENAEELARLETRNVGKPISDSRGEVAMVAEVFHFYAGAVDKHHGETIPVAGGIDMTFREPLGVVGLIVPWNFPLAIASWKLGPALACGHTVVLKPAELTPLTAVRL